ncbi:uncharacterized protein [Haliotis asinina]|uniref:uncharacterized protein n=1 Tax=Haliotis asinina TaxID=109174 RepID=UPI003531D637
MKAILVAALLVCLLAIHSDAYLYHRNYRIRMSWRRTTSCIYRAARRLSFCYGVRSRFRYYRFGKREIENADENAENTELPENEDLISARNVMEPFMDDDEGGKAASKKGLRQPTDA